MKQLRELDNAGYNWMGLMGHTLLCWCKRDSFCHRYILADYLEKNKFTVIRH